jgi:hypothetical protein
MLDQAVQSLGTQRLLWGTDLTMDTAWGKLRYLERVGLAASEMDSIAFGNALAVFPDSCFEKVCSPSTTNP